MKNETIKLSGNKGGLSFVEIMLAFGILASVFLPIFKFLTASVKDTEKLYTEIVAISRAKFIMDTLMFQMPWRAIRANGANDAYCTFDDPRTGADSVDELIQKATPKMMGAECETSKSDVYKGDGIYTDRKGFKYRARVKVVDLDKGGVNAITFSVDNKPDPPFLISHLVSKDADGNFNVIKKIVVQIKWSNHKGKDPKNDPLAQSIFLVGFKSRL